MIRELYNAVVPLLAIAEFLVMTVKLPEDRVKALAEAVANAQKAIRNAAPVASKDAIIMEELNR